MESIKQTAIDAIQKLPDTASIEDIMYQLYVIDKIRRGKDSISKGEAISTTELKDEVATW